MYLKDCNSKIVNSVWYDSDLCKFFEYTNPEVYIQHKTRHSIFFSYTITGPDNAILTLTFRSNEVKCGKGYAWLSSVVANNKDIPHITNVQHPDSLTGLKRVADQVAKAINKEFDKLMINAQTSERDRQKVENIWKVRLGLV